MADLVTVTGDFGHADDLPAEGRVWFAPWLDAVHADPDPTLVTRARVRRDLDESGAFSVELIGSHDPAWQTTSPVPYLVTWQVTGSYGQRIVVLPDGAGPFDLFTLVDLAEPPAIVPTPIPGEPGPPGPTAVSADPGNVATLGSDDLIYVSVTAGGVTDHGDLTGLSDPDHPIAAVQGLQAALDGKAPLAHSHALGDLPTTLATDVEVTAAVAAHVAAVDPHPVYLTVDEGAAAYSPAGHTHTAAAVGAEPAGSVAAHDALATAHTALRGTATPTADDAAAAAVGTSSKFAREDHKHAVTVAAPVALGAANAAGAATSLARSDHVHIYPTAAQVGAATQAYVDARTPKITSSTTAPSSPTVGDIWVDMN